ncbi:MAG: SGNH/GDSL hydrolase family protein [Pseudonocardiaceae bacterium]
MAKTTALKTTVLLACVVGMVTAIPSTAATIPAPISDSRSTLAAYDGDGRSSAAPGPGVGDYVALGDSYSSGVGTGVYDPAGGTCARSPLSYPPLWTVEHRPASFGFVACSGATTDDVLASQISALQPGTDLVTITIGGNDAGFGPVLRTCTAADSDDTCFAAVDAAESFERSALPDRLARSYAAIRRSSPNAQVVVLGYARLFDLAPNCTEPQVPNVARRTKLNEGADVLDSVIQSVSQRFGFYFGDVRGQFGNHAVCSTDPWINGPSVPTVVGPYHPNQTGYRNGYLAALDVVTGRGGAAA